MAEKLVSAAREIKDGGNNQNGGYPKPQAKDDTEERPHEYIGKVIARVLCYRVYTEPRRTTEPTVGLRDEVLHTTPPAAPAAPTGASGKSSLG